MGTKPLVSKKVELNKRGNISRVYRGPIWEADIQKVEQW